MNKAAASPRPNSKDSEYSTPRSATPSGRTAEQPPPTALRNAGRDENRRLAR